MLIPNAWMKWGIFALLIFSIARYNYKQTVYEEGPQPPTKPNQNEGYENWSACVEQGYPKDWCMFTPDPMQPAPGYCNCGGGHFGSYHVDGKCNCYLYNPQLTPMYVDKLFHDYLA
jgi:hypothetical protein